MNNTEVEPLSPVWCHSCPILIRCPHRQSRASNYLAEHEGFIDMDPFSAVQMERMENLMRLAVANCPLLKLISDLPMKIKALEHRTNELEKRPQVALGEHRHE